MLDRLSALESSTTGLIDRNHSHLMDPSTRLSTSGMTCGDTSRNLQYFVATVHDKSITTIGTDVF